MRDACVKCARSEQTKDPVHLADTWVATCVTPQWVPWRQDLRSDCGFCCWMASRPKRWLALLLLVPLILSAFRGGRRDTPRLLFSKRCDQHMPPLAGTLTSTSASCPPSANLVISQLGVQPVASLDPGCTQHLEIDRGAWNGTACAVNASSRCGWSYQPPLHPAIGGSGPWTSRRCVCRRHHVRRCPQLAAGGAVGRRPGWTAAALPAERQATCQPAAQHRVRPTALGEVQPHHTQQPVCPHQWLTSPLDAPCTLLRAAEPDMHSD